MMENQSLLAEMQSSPEGASVDRFSFAESPPPPPPDSPPTATPTPQVPPGEPPPEAPGAPPSDAKTGPDLGPFQSVEALRQGWENAAGVIDRFKKTLGVTRVDDVIQRLNEYEAVANLLRETGRPVPETVSALLTGTPLAPKPAEETDPTSQIIRELGLSPGPGPGEPTARQMRQPPRGVEQLTEEQYEQQLAQERDALIQAHIAEGFTDKQAEMMADNLILVARLEHRLQRMEQGARTREFLEWDAKEREAVRAAHPDYARYEPIIAAMMQSDRYAGLSHEALYYAAKGLLADRLAQLAHQKGQEEGSQIARAKDALSTAHRRGGAARLPQQGQNKLTEEERALAIELGVPEDKLGILEEGLDPDSGAPRTVFGFS